MSGERKPARDWSPTMYRGVGALAVVGVWALDTFTVQGFLCALYLAPTEAGMWCPTATRVVWWVLFYVAGSAFVQRLMWREGVLAFSSHRQLWAAAHVSAVKRLTRRVAWWFEGIGSAIEQARADRPAVSTAAVPVPVSRTVQDTHTSETAAA